LRARLKAFGQRHDRPLMLVSGFLAALVAFGIYALAMPQAQRLTQNDIDAAVLHTLKKQPPAPSHAATAYEVIRPSVVLVRRLGEDEANATSQGENSNRENSEVPEPESKESQDNHSNEQESAKEGAAKGARKLPLRGIATGVVFSDDGMIFTNLHVITGPEKIGVVFFDGTESDVDIVGVQPENDLAVLQARTVPDDLVPATLRSTRGLQTGDEVLAVGFPFGIGPTATFGVVSGLRRQHYSEEGRRNLIDLIQFDAAANPGNSGGPLVTREGDVVGIVTSILNPTDQGFFVGIAFAVPIENAATAAGMSPF
jgi:S1-C subfamily serine protease